MFSRKLASFSSYSLYLLHYPPLVFLAAHLAAPWLPDARHLFFGLLLTVLLLVYAYLVASLTEFHNDAVRHWVERLQAS